MNHHIRYSPKWGVPHHVNTRTLVTLCGVSALDWSLFCDKPAVHCVKCAKQIEMMSLRQDQGDIET